MSALSINREQGSGFTAEQRAVPEFDLVDSRSFSITITVYCRSTNNKRFGDSGVGSCVCVCVDTVKLAYKSNTVVGNKI